MSFRTTWLRAVALAWSDDEFRRELTGSDPIQALENAFGFQWPWPDVLEFKVRPQKDFVWVGDDWSWPDDLDEEDALTLRLPLEPRMNDAYENVIPIQEHDWVLAIADYYDVRPSIFGKSGDGGGSPRGESLLTAGGRSRPTRTAALAHPLGTGSVQFAGHEPPPGGFLPSSGAFADFEVVLTAAMAKAWANKAFAALLDDQRTLLATLQTIRGYTSPWKLVLKIQDDKDARWLPRRGKGTPSEWSRLRKHELALNLPSTPASIRDRSIALTAYNATGAQYPLTCCA